MAHWFRLSGLLIASHLTFTVAAATPAATNGAPAESFVGEQVCFDSVLTNTGTVGYSPYLRLILPAELSFDSATSVGSSATVESVGVFPASPSNQLTDPKSVSDVTGQEGSSFALLILPVGSVVENGPDLTTNICLTISSAATVGSPLSVDIQPVFELGDTATGDNGPIEGSVVSASITPTVFAYSYSNSASEGETVPGASFPFTYTHTVDVANSQAIDTTVLSDVLDTDLQFVSPVAETGGTACVEASTPSTSSAGGTLALNCSNISGSTSDSDSTASYSAYVTDILNESTCAVDTLINQSTFDAEYSASTLTQASSSSSVVAKHIAIQQSVSNGSGQPGDTVTITNSIQISDYASASSLVITDTLEDGLSFNTHVSLNSGGVIAITPTVTTDGSGVSTIIYDIHAVTGDLAPGSTITLSYTADIEQSFVTSPSGPVVAADTLTTSTSAVYSLTDGATNCSDSSSANVTILPVIFSKTIVSPQSEYAPGDTITFRLSMEVPSGDTKDIVFEDFLPLPVFDASVVNTTYGVDITRAATDTLNLTPTSITTTSATNSIKVEWPDVVSTSTQTLAIDIDVVVSNEPFADNLQLTNLFQSSTNNTPAVVSAALNTVQLQVRAPDLVITLGVSGTDNTAATLSPDPAGLPVDSDLSGGDAGDQITYVLTIENQGGDSAENVTASVPTLSGLSDAVIVSVLDGEGNSLAYTGSLSDGTFTLTNPLPANDGTLGAPYSTDSAIITFTRDVESDVNPRATITPEASVQWASAGSSTAFPAETDSSSFTLEGPSISTSVASISPGGGGSNIVVGDIVTYQAIITLPEGQTPDLSVAFNLPPGLDYVSSSAATDVTGFSGSLASAPSVSESGTVDSGKTISVNLLGTTTVTNNNNAADNSFILTFDALVKDNSANSASSALQAKNITGEVTYTGISGATVSSSTSSNFAEHQLSVTSSISPATGLTPGDLATITIVVENTGTAPAYDVELSTEMQPVSPASENVFDAPSGNVNFLTTETGFTGAVVGTSVNFDSNAGTSIAAGGTATFVFTIPVQNDPTSSSEFEFSPSISADSQDGVPSSSEQRDDTASSSFTASTAFVTADSMQLIGSSESWTSDSSSVEAAIGEILTYSFTVTLPEGITNEVSSSSILEIAIPDGLRFISGSGLIRGLFDSGISGSNSVTLNGTDTAIVPVESGQTLGFDLGDITNSDRDADDEQVVITVQLLAENTSDNTRGASKSVRGDINFDNIGDGSSAAQTASATDGLTIVLPNLSITKLATPDNVQGGDVVTFTVTAANTNDTGVSRGWEWFIEDNLPTRLQSPSLVSAVLSRSSTDISACATFSGNELDVDSLCLPDTDRYLAPGDSLTIVYSASVDPSIGFEEVVTNTVDFSVTTLPGANGTSSTAPGSPDADDGERTGSQTLNTSGQAVNDLTTMVSDSIVAGAPSVNISASSGDANIGQEVNLTSSFSLPTGTTSDFVYTLDLPAGLTYNNEVITITLPGTDFTSTLSPSTSPGVGTDPLSFDFGSITNSAASSQSIEIVVPVTVDNTLSVQDADILTSTGSLSYAGVSAPAPTNSVDVEVIEANLTLQQTIIAGATGSDAGDTITYQTIITNSDTQATAFRVSFIDIFPEGLLGASDGSGSGVFFDNIVLSNPSDMAVLTGTSTVLTEANTSISTTTITNDSISLSSFDLPAASSVTLTYDVVVKNTVSAGDQLTNNASLNYNSLLAGTGRDGSDSGDDDDDSTLNNYTETTSNTLTVDNTIMVQTSLSSVHSDSLFTVGETITFELRVDVTEGEIDSLVLTDVLPTGLSFVSSSVNASSNINFSNNTVAVESPTGTLTFDLGNVSNIADSDATNDLFIVSVIAQVEDIVSNSAGSVLTNSASVASSVASNGPSTVDITIAEPNLQASIVADRTAVTLGDTVTFTATIAHLSSTADARDTSLNVVIPSGVTYVPGSFMGQGSIDDSDGANLLVDLGSIALIDASKTFSFIASVDSDTVVGTAFNVAITNGVYSTLNGTDSTERTYTFSASSNITSDDASFIDAVQAVSLIDDVNGNGLPDPGDVLEYTAVLTNSGFTTTNVIFTELIPDNSTYVAGSLSSDLGTVSDVSGIEVTIGTLNANEVVNVSFRVTIDEGIAGNYEISAQGTVDSDLTVPKLTDSDGDDSNGEQPNVTSYVIANSPPIVNDDIGTIGEDSSGTFTVLANDSDADGHTLSVIASTASVGSVTINPDGTLGYIPPADYNGTVVISYTVSDGNGGTTSGTLTVTVLAGNDSPIANDDTANTDEDEPVNINVLANDSDVDGDSLSVTGATSSVGSVIVNPDGTLTFTPPDDFNGTTTITYTVSDGNGGTTTANVTVTVNAVNDSPIVQDDNATISEDQPVTIDVLSNDSDVEGDLLTVTAASASVGLVIVNPDGSLSYTPPSDFNGEVIVTYTVSDGNGGVSIGTLTIVVSSVNDVPIANDDMATTSEDESVIINVLANDSDADGDQLTITQVSASEGEVLINDDGSLNYTPLPDFYGEVTITYMISDGNGGTATATVTVNVVSVNDPPVVEDLQATIFDNETLFVDVLGQASDADGDILNINSADAGSGSVVINPDGSITYTPDDGFEGEDIIRVCIADTANAETCFEVRVTVVKSNTAPDAVEDLVSITSYDPIAVDVLANDVDAEGDSIEIIGALASVGEVAWENGVITYTPIEGFVGEVIIEYQITDGELTSIGRLVINVMPDDGGLAPVITVPEDVFIDANALFTKVDLGVASAVDRFGNPLPVSLVDGIIFYEPGINTAFWFAEDSEGRSTLASQLVRVRPLVSIDKDQTVLEGYKVRVGVNLNGTSPVYPLTIPYTVSGSADIEDHDLVSGSLIIESGSDGEIQFEIYPDRVDEGVETIEIELSDEINRGNKFRHVITIAEDNIDPSIELFATQNSEQRILLTKNGGLVTINASIFHPDIFNQYNYVWRNIEQVLMDEDSADESFTFDPSLVEAGLYRIELKVSDADALEYDDIETIYIQIVDSLPTLTEVDSDLDGIADNIEGFKDTDRDGILDYLDPIPECNVLPEEASFVDGYLVEGDPGVCLRRGNFSLNAENGGAKVVSDDIDKDATLVPDPNATNIGGIFDFIAYGLSDAGQNYKIVMPQIKPIPENAVYRKFTTELGWYTFVEDGNNILWSTAGEPGYCPPPGGDVWEPGLIEGYWCVQIQISDGGQNDADGLVNSTLVDPGGVGVLGVGINSLPIALDDIINTETDLSIEIEVLSNDSDPDGDVLFITSATPTFGTVTFTDTLISYTPLSGYSGADSIQYGISDGNGGTDLATVSITVVGNLPPVATDDTVNGFTNQPTVVSVLNNDNDPEGGSLSILSATSETGQTVVNLDGTVTYTPPTDFVGNVVINYVIQDEKGAIGQAQIILTLEREVVSVRIENSGGGSLFIISIWMLLLLLYRNRQVKVRGKYRC